MDINKLSEWLKDNKLVALTGTDLELVKNYIDDKCIIIIPKKYYKSASLAMGTSHIEEAQKRRK